MEGKEAMTAFTPGQFSACAHDGYIFVCDFSQGRIVIHTHHTREKKHSKYGKPNFAVNIKISIKLKFKKNN